MTSANAKDYLPLVKALSEGKVIQYRVTTDSPWANLDDPGLQAPPELYRICPEKKRVPLEPSDVPPGSVIWETGWPPGTWEMVTGIEGAGVRYADALRDWEYLMREARILRPGKDWANCWKELSE